MNIFISGQQTETLFNFLLTNYCNKDKDTFAEDMSIKASAPAFNLRNSESKKLFNVEQVDIPVFGLKIQQAVYEFLQDYTEDLKKLNISLKWELNSFAQGKKDKMLKVLEFLERSERRAERSERGEERSERGEERSESINRLKNFISDFCSLEQKDISSLEDWNTFLLKHNITNWENNLHFDRVFTLFGFDEEEGKKLNSIEFKVQTKNEKGEWVWEETTVKQYCTRWIAKSVAGFSMPGCIVDLVNLACAMTEIKDPYQALKELKESRGNVKWAPQVFLHDGELDDMLCLCVLRKHLCGNQNYILDVVGQLPADPEFDFLEKSWIQDKKANFVLRDKLSTNQPALRSFYKIK